MAIMYGPDSINLEKVLKSAEAFCKENKMTEEETSEVKFLSEAFCKYYNSMSKKDEAYTSKMISESFDEMIKGTLMTDNWSGLTTHANLFVKEVPAIKKILERDSLDKIIDESKFSKKIEDKSYSKSKDYDYPKYDFGACIGGCSYGPSC